MNILYARMQGYEWVSTPSDAVARELERLGHTITIVETADYVPPKGYDFIWSPYETSLLVANAISKKYNIPLISHLEIIPPWRVFENIDIESYGYPKGHAESQPQMLAQTSPYYKKIADVWKHSDIKTLSTPVRLPYHEKYFGPLEDINIRFPSVDARAIERAKQMYSPKRQENVILTLSRLAYVKRIDLLVEVMNRVKTKVIWRVVGDGEFGEVIKDTLTNENVTLELVKSKWGWAKFYEMMSPRLFIAAVSAMPQMEAILCGTPALIIEAPGSAHIPEFNNLQKSQFNGAIPTFECGEYERMAEAIDKEMSIPYSESTLIQENDTVNKFLNGECGVTSSEDNAKQLTKLMVDFLQKQ